MEVQIEKDVITDLDQGRKVDIDTIGAGRVEGIGTEGEVEIVALQLLLLGETFPSTGSRPIQLVQGQLSSSLWSLLRPTRPLLPCRRLMGLLGVIGRIRTDREEEEEDRNLHPVQGDEVQSACLYNFFILCS